MSPGREGGQDLVALRSAEGRALVAATALSSTVPFLGAYVVYVAVPAIGADLRSSAAGMQWVVTAYLLALAALILIAGMLVDHVGRRPVLRLGLLVSVVSSVLCAVAPTTEALVAARLLQGAGAALVVPSSLAMLNGTLRVADRARGIGLWAGLATLGTTFGPYAGGWLVDQASWRYVFVLNVPLALAALWALTRVPDVRSRRRRPSADVGGGLLSVVGLAAVVWALATGPARGWSDLGVLAAGAVGVLLLAALLPVERQQRDPLLPVPLLRSRQLGTINVATLLVFGAVAAASYLVVLQCQFQLGYSATAAGAALVPQSLVFLVLSPLVGSLVARTGARVLMVSGMVVTAGALLWLSAIGPGDRYVTAVLPGAVLWGIGLVLTVVPLTSAVLQAVEDGDLGAASALNDAAARVGAVLMVALVPALLGAGGQRLGDALAGGYQPAMAVLAALGLGAALVTRAFVEDAAGDVPVPVLVPPPSVHACPVPDRELVLPPARLS